MWYQMYIVNEKQIGKWESDISQTYRFTRCKIVEKVQCSNIPPESIDMKGKS